MNGTASDTESWSYSLRSNFYALTPSETYFEDVGRIPNLGDAAFPVMLLMMTIEALILKFTKPDNWRLHNIVLNYSSRCMSDAASNFLFRGAELSAYIWVYNNYRFNYLLWDSLVTYIVGLLGYEFCYYWWHRASHELAVMWASHSSHHSCEDFNMTVAVRTSFANRPLRWFSYMPLAFLGLPPSIFVIHQRLSHLYAVWTHTSTVPRLDKVIPGLGRIIEFIFLTPSHHRVHHGANKYCIDKNYGQTFIIFDRMFGTVAEERDDEPLVYGILDQAPRNSVGAITISPWVELWHKMKSMNTFGDKVRSLVYGPGWTPGKPRLGDPNELPDVRGRQKLPFSIPLWVSSYVLIHSALLLYLYKDMVGRSKDLGSWLPLLNLFYIFMAFTSLGSLYESRRHGAVLELVRLFLFFAITYTFPTLVSAATTRWVSWVMLLSVLMWPAFAWNVNKRNVTKKKKAK